MKKMITILTLCSIIVSTQAQIQLDVVGDKLRLTSTSDVNKYIQLRTDGGAVDIDVGGGLLYINSAGVLITKMDTTSTAKTNLVRQADGTLGVRQYKVGDFAHGGIIFYVDETGEHGLACDTSDISTGIQWYNGVYKVINSRGDGVAAGEMNTMLIIAQQTIDSTTGNFAALICANLVRGSYGDWYLPSKEELNLMYMNKEAINATAVANGGSSFANAHYWSSTEYNSFDAWEQSFMDGNQDWRIKASAPDYRVRAVRAF